MRGRFEGFTPTQAAYSTAIDALRNQHREVTFYEQDMTSSEQLAYRRALAKLHNRLLDQSKLDGLHLGD